MSDTLVPDSPFGKDGARLTLRDFGLSPEAQGALETALRQGQAIKDEIRKFLLNPEVAAQIDSVRRALQHAVATHGPYVLSVARQLEELQRGLALPPGLPAAPEAKSLPAKRAPAPEPIEPRQPKACWWPYRIIGPAGPRTVDVRFVPGSTPRATSALVVAETWRGHEEHGLQDVLDATQGPDAHPSVRALSAWLVLMWSTNPSIRTQFVSSPLPSIGNIHTSCFLLALLRRIGPRDSAAVLLGWAEDAMNYTREKRDREARQSTLPLPPPRSIHTMLSDPSAYLEPGRALLSVLELRGDTPVPDWSSFGDPQAPFPGETGRDPVIQRPADERSTTHDPWVYGWPAIVEALAASGFYLTRKSVQRRMEKASKEGAIRLETGRWHGQKSGVRVRHSEVRAIAARWRTEDRPQT